MTTGPDECACGTPTRDHAYMCETCTDQLAIALGDVPAIVDELETTLTGERAKNPGGGPANPAALHYNTKAGDILRRIRLELLGDVRICVKAHIRHSSPHPGLPANNPQAMSRWLLWRVDGLAYSEHGPAMLARLTAIAAATERAIDNRPPRIFLGSCTTPTDDGTECGAGIYAAHDAPTGKCSRPDCKTKYDIEASRRNLEDALDNRLCTASEIARLSVYLGLKDGRDKVRNRVYQWKRRGRIVPHGSNASGEPVYLYGEVRTLLYQEVAQDA